MIELPKISEKFDPFTIAMKFILTNWGFNFRPRYFLHIVENNHYIVIIDLIFKNKDKIITIKNIGNIIINEVAEIIAYTKQESIDNKIKRYYKRNNI